MDRPIVDRAEFGLWFFLYFEGLIYSGHCLWRRRDKLWFYSPGNWLQCLTLIFALDRVTGGLRSSSPDDIYMSQQLLILIGWHNHPRHPCIAIQFPFLGDIVALEIWLESSWELDWTQISFGFGYHILTLIIIVATRYLGIERFDGYTSRVAQDRLTGSLVDSIRFTGVHVPPHHAAVKWVIYIIAFAARWRLFGWPPTAFETAFLNVRISALHPL